MAADPRMKYLQRLHLSYYVRIKVPPSLQERVGNTHIRRALHTRNLEEANQLKWPMIARIKRELEKLKSADPDGIKAGLYRDAIKEAKEAEDYNSEVILTELAAEHAEQVHKATDNLAKAQAWYQLATTDQKPLSELLDEWLDASEYTSNTKDKHRKAYQEFKDWLGSDCLPSMVDDRMTIDYVDNHLKPQKLANRTKSGKLGSLSNFWNYLGSKLYVPKGNNPWKGHKMASKSDSKRNPDKRPYTDLELVTLLNGFVAADATGYADKTVLPSIVLLGLYTGAREEELCRIRVEDIDVTEEACYVRIQDSKTKAGIREMAISHAVPVAIFKNRLSMVSTGFIFPDLKEYGEDKKRSHYLSKQFGVIRRKLGIPDGTDYHSFRRNLMTLLENLGVDYVPAARYVGHQIPTLMHTTYSSGSWRQTSLKLAQRIKYDDATEEAAKGLLKFATATAVKPR
jgi:integrase